MESQSKSEPSPAVLEALWKLLMQRSDPDILQSIIDQTTARHFPSELKPMGDQAIILVGCTVTIQHLTISGPADPELRAP